MARPNRRRKATSERNFGMSDKYIIKNCPAFLDDVQLLEFSEGTCNSLQNHRAYCQDCTDCLSKQIVKQAGYCLCPEILELLDIQEVE